MAMDNTNPVRFNTGVGGTDAFDLLLPTWAAEIVSAYESSNIFEGLVSSLVIENGVEKRFPVTGRVGLVEAWEAGQALEGGGGPTDDIIVKLDSRPMASHIELDNIDEMVEQFDYRSAMLREMGRRLAATRDERLARLIVKAALSTATQLDESGLDTDYSGRSIVKTATLAADAPGALEMLEAIEAEIVSRMQLDIDTAGMVMAVKPDMFMQIRRLGVADSADTGITGPLFGGVAEQGGLGESLAKFAGVLTYQGCSIVPTNHLPQGNAVVGAGGGQVEAGDANYAVDASGVTGLIWQPEAVAAIRKQDLKLRMDDDIRRNSHFFVSSMFSGGGVVRPELAAVVKSA